MDSDPGESPNNLIEGGYWHISSPYISDLF